MRRCMFGRRLRGVEAASRVCRSVGAVGIAWVGDGGGLAPSPAAHPAPSYFCGQLPCLSPSLSPCRLCPPPPLCCPTAEAASVTQGASSTPISNEALTLSFNADSGRLVAVAAADGSWSAAATQALMWYQSSVGQDEPDCRQPSGAYIFRPDNEQLVSGARGWGGVGLCVLHALLVPLRPQCMGGCPRVPPRGALPFGCSAWGMTPHGQTPTSLMSQARCVLPTHHPPHPTPPTERTRPPPRGYRSGS